MWIGFPKRLFSALGDQLVSQRNRGPNVLPDELLGPDETFSDTGPSHLALLVYASTAFLLIHDIDQARAFS